MEELLLKPIAHIKTDFPDKFGLPRQSMLVPELYGRIVFSPEYRTPDALRGLDGYSHLWIIWGFSEGFASKNDIGTFSPTVRPPRLGGNKRVGVFATRSPNRPNPIALSCVRFERIEHGNDGDEIIVSGIDMADGTPIYDIKPYLPNVDAHPDAVGGFSADVSGARLDVKFADGVSDIIPAEKINGLCGALREDPRPQYQNGQDRVYGLSYAGYEIGFTVKDNTLTVVSAVKTEQE